MNKFMPLLTLDNKPLVLKGDGGGQQPATLTIKTIGTPQHTTATMSYIDVNGVWKTSQIDYTNDVVVNTMIKGIVTINITPFSAFGITNVSGCNRYALQTYNPPFVQAFYITDSNATVTFYSSD